MAECYCVNIEDTEWDRQEFSWQNKYFYTLPIKMFFNVPVGLDMKTSWLMQRIKSSGYALDYPVKMFLQVGRFKGNLMVETTNPKEEDPNIRMIKQASGTTYISRQPFNKIKKDVAKIILNLRRKKIEVKNIYLWYVNCPMCTGRKGYKTVIFAQTK